jgi:ABC-type glycerol-3-phosphate transport system substrate-binding protein
MYGYPSWGIDAYALTWNKDIFKEVGLDPNTPPKYWKDFRDASKKTAIANADGTMQRVGYAVRHLGEPAGIVDKWDWLIEGAGGKLNTDPTALKGGSVLLDTPDMVAGFQMAHDMIWVDKSTSLNFPDPREAFLKGIAAFQISELVSIQVRQPTEAPGLNWGFAPAPAKAAGSNPSVHISAWDTVVFSQSPNKELGLKAIKWFNSVENDYAQAKKYGSTPRYLVNWAKAPFNTDAKAQQFKTLLPYGRPYPLTLQLSQIIDATGTAIQKILHTNTPVEQLLKEAQDKGNAAIQQ